jgi:hypothetical protein
MIIRNVQCGPAEGPATRTRSQWRKESEAGASSPGPILAASKRAALGKAAGAHRVTGTVDGTVTVTVAVSLC